MGPYGATLPLSVTIVDYGAGNLRNVQKALEFLGCQAPIISNQVDDLAQAEALILPGVGAFHMGMQHLRDLGLDIALRVEVLEKRKPLLGICLGMQLLATEGHEGGRCDGLGLLPMVVRRLRCDGAGLRVPHMGWNNVCARRGATLFVGVPVDPDFYFVHSYHAECVDENIVAATCEYGQTFVAAVEHSNIFATQFHPEKSQRYGLQVLSNFLKHCEVRPAGSVGRLC